MPAGEIVITDDVTVIDDADGIASSGLFPKIKHAVAINEHDATLGLFQSNMGSVLSSMKTDGFEYLFSGARANVGLKSGCYAFEVRVLESPSSPPQQQSVELPRHGLRLGFSRGQSSLILGNSPDNVCFSSDGGFSVNGEWRVVQGAKEAFLGPGDVVTCILNLDRNSPDAYSFSVCVNGDSIDKPLSLPDELRGCGLYPAITLRGAVVEVNFGRDELWQPLPLGCKSVQEALGNHVEETQVKPPQSKTGVCEVVMPVGLPDESLLTWCDAFLEDYPHFVELSDRTILELCLESGLKPVSGMGIMGLSAKDSRLSFGVPGIDNMSVRLLLDFVASRVRRHLLVLDVDANLLYNGRAECLKRFSGKGYKTTAVVILGQPPQSFKEIQEEFTYKRKRRRQGLATGTVKRRKLSWDFEDAINEQAFDLSSVKVSVPRESEGFTELRFLWQDRSDAEKFLRDWAVNHKDIDRVEQITPSAWFNEKLKAWELEREELITRQRQFQDGTAPCKEDKERVKAERDEEQNKQELDREIQELTDVKMEMDDLDFEVKDENKKNNASEVLRKKFLKLESKEAKEEDVVKEEVENMDDDQAQDENVEDEYPEDDNAWQDQLGIWECDNIHDADGSGEPLYGRFALEDWSLLNLRFELLLLLHAFQYDVADSESQGMNETYVHFYYGTYFQQVLEPAYFGCDTLEELVELVQDTVRLNRETRTLEALLPTGVDSSFLVKLTEEARRNRRERLDAGDELARLSFSVRGEEVGKEPSQSQSAPSADTSSKEEKKRSSIDAILESEFGAQLQKPVSVGPVVQTKDTKQASLLGMPAKPPVAKPPGPSLFPRGQSGPAGGQVIGQVRPPAPLTPGTQRLGQAAGAQSYAQRPPTIRPLSGAALDNALRAQATQHRPPAPRPRPIAPLGRGSGWQGWSK